MHQHKIDVLLAQLQILQNLVANLFRFPECYALIRIEPPYQCAFRDELVNKDPWLKNLRQHRTAHVKCAAK